MSLSINDQLSPALRRKLAKIKDKRPVLAAAGAALASVATRAFRIAALRPKEWPKLKDATLKRKGGRGGPLIDTGALFRSILAKEPEADSVEVGTDRTYALYHQFGTKKMQERPFFPVVDDSLTPAAQKAVRAAMAAQIDALLK